MDTKIIYKIERNENVEALRGIAILCMLIYHYSVTVVEGNLSYNTFMILEALGQVGLIGFIVISGYGSFCYFDKQVNAGAKVSMGQFIKRRLKGILPQYWFCLLVVLLFTTNIGFLSIDNIKHVMVYLLLLQDFFPESQGAINGATWTLATIFHLYFFAVPLFKLVKRWGIKSYFISVLFSIGFKLILTSIITGKDLSDLYYLWASIRLPFSVIDLFIAGMCVAMLSNNIREKNVKTNNLVIGFTCIILFIAMIVFFLTYSKIFPVLYGDKIHNNIWQSIIGLIYSVLLYFGTFFTFNYKSLIGRLVQLISKNEFGIYLWHMPLIGNIVIYQPELYLIIKNKSDYAAIIILVILAVIWGITVSRIITGFSKNEASMKG